jgi:hypothetical protein
MAYAEVEVQSLIPNFGIRWSCVQLHIPDRFTLGDRAPGTQCGSYSHQYRDFAEQKNLLGLPGIERFLGCPDNSQVAIQTLAFKWYRITKPPRQVVRLQSGEVNLCFTVQEAEGNT